MAGSPELEIYRNKRVLLTGHTGFKGSWMAGVLEHLGAEVHGLALEAEGDRPLFGAMGLEARLGRRHAVGDMRDFDYVKRRVVEVQPDIVFHLAAQPLVRASYGDPLGTYATNVMGTMHVLEALKGVDGSRPVAGVMITTDKVYENREWVHGYRETDVLGGVDPYSSSKAACEIGIASMRRSFFGEGKPFPHVGVASARAGNVIGGGDRAKDRIVPDCMRMLAAGEPIPVRNPHATRPWQHVLDPLAGYLRLGSRLYQAVREGRFQERQRLESAFNFGPDLRANRTVRELVETVLRYWPGRWEDLSDPDAVHEASLLHLQIDKAWHELGWRPRWDFETAVEQTVAWYREAEQQGGAPGAMADFSLGQVEAFLGGEGR